MLTQAKTITELPVASPAEQHALADLMTEPEAPLSDAPVWAPESFGFLLLLILLSPKEPRGK